MLLLIYRFSLFAGTLSCPIPLSPTGLIFQLDTLFLLFAHNSVSRGICDENRDGKFGKAAGFASRTWHSLLTINTFTIYVTVKRVFVITVGSTSSLIACFYDNFFFNNFLTIIPIKIVWLSNLGLRYSKIYTRAWDTRNEKSNRLWRSPHFSRHMYLSFLISYCCSTSSCVMRQALTHSHIHTHSLLFVDNPVLCDAGLADLTVALEVNHAKVYGVGSDCPTTTMSVPPTVELTSELPPPPLLLLAAVAATSSNVSFAATLE